MVVIEQWRDIDGYEELYQVSNIGRIKSLSREIWNGYKHYIREEKILSLTINPQGYYKVSLCKNNKVTSFLVHRLVAKAFVLNPNEYNVVNHKDENKLNNSADNLEWCTQKYNFNYSCTKINYKSEERIRLISLAQSKKVYQYDTERNLIKEWESARKASENGFCESHISSCCTGKRKTHKGFIWLHEKLQVNK